MLVARSPTLGAVAAFARRLRDHQPRRLDPAVLGRDPAYPHTGVYGLTLTHEFLHEAEHAIYLTTALLVWAPLIGADPLPHRPRGRGQFACMLACMLPMGLIALWLASAPNPLYAHYVAGTGRAALEDQSLAATIMWVGGIPAFAIPALARTRVPLLRSGQRADPPRAHAQASGTR